jgi:hypothetical protein
VSSIINKKINEKLLFVIELAAIKKKSKIQEIKNKELSSRDVANARGNNQ